MIASVEVISWFEMCNLLSTNTTMFTPIENEKKKGKKKTGLEFSSTKFTLIFEQYSSFFYFYKFFSHCFSIVAQIIRNE